METFADVLNTKDESLFFYRMLCPASTEFTQYYLTEEEERLNDFVVKHTPIKDMNFVVVGAGPLLHLSLGCQMSKCYVAVDPIANLFTNDISQDLALEKQKIKILNKYFEELEPNEIPAGNSLYVFTFNVISYIKNFEATVNKIIKNGDILFISYWNNSKENEALIHDYFNFVYGQNGAQFRRNMIDTGDIACERINHFKYAQKFCGRIVKTIIAYT